VSARINCTVYVLDIEADIFRAVHRSIGAAACEVKEMKQTEHGGYVPRRSKESRKE